MRPVTSKIRRPLLRALGCGGLLAFAACSDRDPVAPRSELEPNAALIGVTIGTTLRGGSNYTTVDVGFTHSCHTKAFTYAAYTVGDCWGASAYGNPNWVTLMDGANLPARPLEISLGLYHGCGVDLYNNGWCWGQDQWGQLGFGGTLTFLGYPGLVSGNHQFKTISAGGWHSCGVDLAGDAWCWGDNTYGQLGIASHGGTSSSPVRVVGGNTWASITTGQWHSCGITTTGNLLCWGHGVWGQLGVTNPFPPPECDTSRFRCATSPRQVQPGTKFSMVSAGFAHSCAITTAGAAFCWGSNKAGQLGDGGLFASGSTPASSITPVAVSGGHTFANVSAGMGYSCGVTTAGKGYCWGDNSYGQLGYGGPIGGISNFINEPTAVATSYTFASIATGYNHTCGITPWSFSGNVLLCWGDNREGQLGDGTISTTSTPVVSRGY